MPPFISEKIAKRTLRDIEFIHKQIRRFAIMSFEEEKAYLRRHPTASFCQIPHPNGSGHLLCGNLAWERVRAITNIVVELDRDLGRRVSREQIAGMVTKAFTLRVLASESAPCIQTAVDLLEDVLVSIRNSLRVNEHYLPCILFPTEGPDEFQVGPVTFTRKIKFFRDKKVALRHSIDTETKSHIEHVKAHIARGFCADQAFSEIDSRNFIRRLHARAIRTYRTYPWIASVRVAECDEDTSLSRATQAVEMAIHVLRIILGGEHTRKIRLAWSKSEALRTAHLKSDSSYTISASIGTNSMGPVGLINWHKALVRSSRELEVLGSSLQSIVEPQEINHLHHRLLDAINWFGDAATDSNRSASIVKYTSAIERLLFGEFQQGRRKLFSNRIKSILNAFDSDADGKSHQKALEVYDKRSMLVHGEWHESRQDVDAAADLSRICILCAAELYLLMLRMYKNPCPAVIEEAMNRINKEGLDWLLSEAQESLVIDS